jgi:methyl-accepting chemotaxis protein
MLSRDLDKENEMKKEIEMGNIENDRSLYQIGQILKDRKEDLKSYNLVIKNLYEFRNNRDKVLDFISQKKIDKAIGMAVGIQTELYNKIRDNLKDLGDKAQERSFEAEKSTRHASGIANILMVIIGITAILFSLLLVISILNIFSKIMHEVREGINVLGSASTEILSISSQVSAGSSEISSAIAETTTTVEEVRQTAILAGEKANKVLDLSQLASNTALNGKESVLETIEGIKRINLQMNLISESVSKLSDQSREIGEITASVTDIADQSNLLAVNASIEAAKAGEQGRGFSVVAQEIRNLAEQSKQATQQVKVILNDIQKAVNLSVMATEKGAKAVDEGSRQAIQSGDVIKHMADNISEINQAAIQISASSQQQIIGMEQIVPAMESIKTAGEQNLAGTRQTHSSANNLSVLGQNLKELMEKFGV